METIKARKQRNSITLTVPAKFHINPGTILEPRLTDKGIFYEFVDKDEFFDFDKDILTDLIAEGYEGYELVDKFVEFKKQIPNALNKLRDQALKEPTLSKEEAMKEFGL